MLKNCEFSRPRDCPVRSAGPVKTKAFVRKLPFQLLDLLQMRRPVLDHSLDQFRQGKLPLQFGMECSLLQIPGFYPPQQTQSYAAGSVHTLPPTPPPELPGSQGCASRHSDPSRQSPELRLPAFGVCDTHTRSPRPQCGQELPGCTIAPGAGLRRRILSGSPETAAAISRGFFSASSRCFFSSAVSMVIESRLFSIHCATSTFQPNSLVMASRNCEDADGSPCTK